MMGSACGATSQSADPAPKAQSKGRPGNEGSGDIHHRGHDAPVSTRAAEKEAFVQQPVPYREPTSRGGGGKSWAPIYMSGVPAPAACPSGMRWEDLSDTLHVPTEIGPITCPEWSDVKLVFRGDDGKPMDPDGWVPLGGGPVMDIKGCMVASKMGRVKGSARVTLGDISEQRARHVTLRSVSLNRYAKRCIKNVVGAWPVDAWRGSNSSEEAKSLSFVIEIECGGSCAPTPSSASPD